VERRLGTFDGVLAISSPPGGPTIVVIGRSLAWLRSTRRHTPDGTSGSGAQEPNLQQRNTDLHGTRW
jgi:hypothetical protein